MKGVPGIVTGAQLDETCAAIASVQTADGNIPWIPGGHTDPWNLVEAAMALDLGGLHTEAERAYLWLTRMQNPDASWHAYYVGTDIKDPTLDTNVAAYFATGVWHHYLCTGDTAFLRAGWLMVERTIDYVLSCQTETGEIAWRARRHAGRRAADRVVERAHEPALRDRHRGAARPRAPGLGAVARRAGDRDRPPARALPRQAALGDGLVLPDPRRRAAGPGRAGAHRRTSGTRSWSRAAASAACRTSRG